MQHLNLTRVSFSNCSICSLTKALVGAGNVLRRRDRLFASPRHLLRRLSLFFGVGSAFITLSDRVEAVFNNAKSTSSCVVDFLFSQFLKPAVFFCLYLLFLLLLFSGEFRSEENELFVVFTRLSLFATSSATTSGGRSCLSTFLHQARHRPPSLFLAIAKDSS